MSTPDQPDAPLTRRRLREIRATGANPVITPADQAAAAEAAAAEAAAAEAAAAEESAAAEAAEAAAAEAAAAQAAAAEAAAAEAAAAEAAAAEAAAAEAAAAEETAAADAAAEAAPEPSSFAPPAVAPAPLPDPHLDLGVSPLTRRQARAQERIRTASVPVIQPDAIPGGAAPAVPPAFDSSLAGTPEIIDAVGIEEEQVAAEDLTPADEASDVEELAAAAQDPDDDGDQPESLVVNPELGSELLAGDQPEVALPASFDSLIARGSSSTGSVATPNALILSQTPTATPLGPITATGEVLITGSFDLPAGFGSAGTPHGTTDGKDVDAALIDGELPPASSPTPIAASAAISTARHSGEEIIRPPAPEKGNKLMLALVITAGVLALAVVGVLIFAVTTGVF